MYIEYTELCVFFEKLYTLNIQNFVQFLKIVYVKYKELCTFFESLDIKCVDVTLFLIWEEKCSHIKNNFKLKYTYV